VKDASLVAFGFYVFALITGCLLYWSVIIYRLLNRQRVAPIARPRPLAPWGLLDLFVGFLFVFLFAGFFGRIWMTFDLPTRTLSAKAATVEPQLTDAAKSDDSKSALPESDATAEKPETANQNENVTGDETSVVSESNFSMSFQTWLTTSQLVAMIATTFWVCFRCRVGFDRAGWRTKRLPKQIVLGVAFAILFAPPMYVIMAVLTTTLDQEYKHPLIEMIGKDPMMLWFAIWTAVIVAPITEEFAFRVMLQGFLESMSAGSIGMADILLGRQSFWPVLSLSHTISIPPVDNDAVLEDPQTQFAESPNTDSVPTGNTDASANSQLLQARLDERSVSNETPVNVGALPWWPVIVSGLLFGLLHYSYGVSWIPLSLLGIVLGWLYRITGTIWPSLVVHMVVNATSMAALATQLMSQAK
jgi:membrane protease YdiL (CAAX protease family)